MIGLAPFLWDSLAWDRDLSVLAQYAINIWLPNPLFGPPFLLLYHENKVTFLDTKDPVKTAVLATKDPRRHHPRRPRG
jgi:hypothetical protein